MSQLDQYLSAANNSLGGGTSPYLLTGVVRAIRAPYALRVRLATDRYLNDEDLVWSYPLLPPNLLPVVGELVRVFLPDPARPQAERYWAGPFFTGWEQLPGQRYPSGHYATTDDAWTQTNGAARPRGLDSRYPDPGAPERVHQLSRGNSDAVYSKEGSFLRAARNAWADRELPNATNPALMGLSPNPDARTSTALVRAEQIVLLSGKLPAADPLLPTSAEIKAAAEGAHPLAFADVLAAQLEVFRQALVEHLHPGPGKAPVQDNALRQLLALDFSQLGSTKLIGK